MSNAIDKRIVEMQFNNQQFEKGVSQSLSTLDKLKAALHFDNVNDGISKLNFSSVGNAVASVGEKFTAFEAIALGALTRIGAAAADTGMKLVKSLSIDQIASGWSKYEQKTTAVQTIMAATASEFEDQGEQMEYVNSQLEKLNWFTDETSYNFVDMVGNIGKFTSNGIALESAVTSMQGIANWAAISGQNAATASRAMYNLSQAIGVGKVTLIDWKSIENANMSTREFKQTAIDMAVELGTLTKSVDGYKTATGGAEVSVEKFNSTLEKGWFTKDVLQATLDKYGSFTNKLYDFSETSGLTATQILKLVDAQKSGELSTSQLDKELGNSNISIEEAQKAIKDLASEENEFGLKAFKAAQEAKTLTDAIDATKDAVSTGWMNTFETIFGDYLHAKDLWTNVAESLYDIFASGGEIRNEILEEWASSGWEVLERRISRAGVKLEDFEATFKSMASGRGINIQGLIDQYGSLGQVIAEGVISSETLSTLVQRSLSSIANNMPIAEETLANTEERLKEIQKVVSDVWSGALGNGSERKKAIEDLGYEYDFIQGLVEKGSDYVVQLTDLSDEQLKAIGYTQEQVDLINELRQDTELLGNLTGYGGTAMAAEGLLNVLRSIADVISIVRSTFSEVFGIDAVATLTSMTTSFLNFSKSLRLVDDESEELTENGERVSSVLEKIFQVAKNVAGVFRGVGRIFQQFGSTLGPVWEALGHLGESFLTLINSVANRLTVFTNGIDLTDKFQSISDTAANVINFFADAIDSLASKINVFKTAIGSEDTFSALSEMADSVKSFISGSEDGSEKVSLFSRALDGLGQALAYVKKVAGPVWEVLKNMFGGMKNMFDFSKVQSLGDFFQQLVAGIGEALGGLWKGIKEGVKNLDISLGDVLKTFAGLKLGQALINGFKKGGLTSALKSLVGNIDESIGAFREGGIMGLLTGTGSGGKGGFDFDQLAESLYKIGKAILMVAGALILLSAVDPKKLTSALGILVTAIASMVGIMVLAAVAFKKFKVSAVNIVAIGLTLLAAAAAMLIIAASLLVLAAALEAFILIAKQGDDAQTGMLAMGAALAMVVVALLALSLAGPTVLAAAGALLIASAALLVFAVALEAFTLIVKQGSDVAVGLIVMVGALVLLAGVLAILAVIGPGVIVAAGALLIGAAAMLVLSAAIGVLVVALTLVGPMLMSLGAGFEALGKGLGQGIAGLLTGIAQGGIAIAQMVVVVGVSVGAAITAIGMGLGAGISAAGTGIGAGLEAIGAGLGGGLALIGEGIRAGFQAIGDGIGGAFESVGEGVANASAIAGSAVEMLGENISNAFETVAGGISEASTVVSSAVDEFGSSIGETIEGVGASIESSLEKVSSGISNLSSSLSDIGSGLSGVAGGIDNFKTAIGGLADLPLVSIGAGMVKVSDGIKKLNKNPLTIDTSQVTEYVTALSTLGEISGTIETSFTSVQTGVQEIGKQIGTNLATGIASTTSMVQQIALTVAKAALNSARIVLPAFSATGEEMGQNMASGLQSQAGTAQSAGQYVARSAYSGTLGYYSQFYHTGENMGQGLANGLASMEDRLRAVARQIAQAAVDEANTTVNNGSPSKVFHEIGAFMAEGLALGMSDSAHMVTDAAAFMTGNAISIAQILANQINDILEDPDAQPTITPVLDLNTLQNQASAIDSIVSSNRALSLSGRIAGQMDYNQNGGVQNVVALDPVTIAQIASNQPDININFDGSLAQLARVLQPEIVYETNRLGPNLVNE